MSRVLPVLEKIVELRSALDSAGAAVLVAPPGTGKTTAVPPALIEEPWLAGRTVLMLEPRRLAARAAADRMASVSGERVGGTFGYSVRGSSKRSETTRVEVVTVGVFLRRLQSDPGLEGVGAVVFDEFHERAIDSDLALALLLDARAALRPDLRVLIMSATLDAEPVAEVLSAPVVRAESQMFPVEIRYRQPDFRVPLERRVRDAIVEALHNDVGDVLVFLPGRPEIRRVRRALALVGVGSTESPESADPAPTGATSGIAVVELHGSLGIEEQRRAIIADPRSHRRVILATSIAETSVTVEGVRIIVDSGLRRKVSLSPGNGLPALTTTAVSISGADQRAGRAGRTSPGVAYRLWSEGDNRHRPDTDPPEILGSDLSSLALQVRAWGAGTPHDLTWIDPPPVAAMERATELLSTLGAFTDSGGLTERGRNLARLGYHPRLASVVAEGLENGLGDLAAKVAAVIETAKSGDPDVVERIRLVDSVHGLDDPSGWAKQLGTALRQWRSTVRDLEKETGRARPGAEVTRRQDLGDDVAKLLLAAFPDRVARRRDVERVDDRSRARTVFHLRSGGEVLVDSEHPLARSRWIVVADLDAATGSLHLGAACSADLVRSRFVDDFTSEVSVSWSQADRRLQATSCTRFGQISFDHRNVKSAPPELIRRALWEALRSSGPGIFGRLDEARVLRARVKLCRAQSGDASEWPDFSDESLTTLLPDWLGGRVERIRNGDDLDRIDIAAVLAEQLDWSHRTTLDRMAPKFWVVGGGRKVELRYGEVDGDPSTVIASVRIRDALGTDAHPTVMDGRVPVVVELLSPAGRPVQRTTDLPGFWRGSYREVRSELRGRYPKHPWPDEPWLATHSRTPRK